MSVTYLVGTTGTGKTALAARLAQKSPTLVISADSRQVYHGMDIVTGKDHPVGLNLVGINLVPPDVPFSVSQWYDATHPLLVRALKSGQSVIVVGGTGFYVSALHRGVPTLKIPLNPELRRQLADKSVRQLQNLLQRASPKAFARLNHSDRHNPRRLIRALEVAMVLPVPPPLPPAISPPLIGLYYQDLSLQRAVIRDRVIARLNSGALSETKALLAQYSPTLPSLSALGYAQISQHLAGEISRAELIEVWTDAEFKYAKRQLTFFRKQNVIWYDRGRMSMEEIYEHLSS